MNLHSLQHKMRHSMDHKIFVALACAAWLMLFHPILLAQDKSSPVTNSAMNGNLFYGLLLAELALLDGKAGNSYAIYLEAARQEPRDELFERAVRIAINARDGKAAIQASTEWTEKIPASALAHNYLFQIHFAQKNYPLGLPALKEMLRLSPEKSRTGMILGLNSYFSSITDKSLAADQIEQVLSPYLASKVHGGDARLVIARAFIHAERYQKGLAELDALTTQFPNNLDAWLLKGSLELQENQFANAELSLRKFLQLAQKDNLPSDHSAYSSAYLQLAQLAEQRKDFELAQNWLSKIEDDKDRLAGQVRRASILAKQGQLNQARALIREVPERTAVQAKAKLMAEVQLLREHKQLKEAIDIVQKALDKTPNDTNLMYELSTLHEKNKDYASMESLLRDIIGREPNNQAALNALGYSFADRGDRLTEAEKLIQRALEITPNDPYILDSLGWVYFRMGQFDKALKILEGAYQTRADAEIGAHLGEVLWKMNRRVEAVKIWKDAAVINAENETLVETLKRLGVTL